MRPRSVVAYLLNCKIELSSNSSRSITFDFELIPLG